MQVLLESRGLQTKALRSYLMFTCYINYLPGCLDYCAVTFYAEDTVLFISDTSLHNVSSYMNSDLESLNKWLKLNHLTFSINKSKFMINGSSQRLYKIDSISFKVIKMDLDDVSSFKFLNIGTNKCLTWQDHVDQMYSQINKNLALLKRLRYCLPFDNQFCIIIL